MKEFKGQLVSKGFKYALIASRFNNFITEKLLDGAKDALMRSGAKEEEIEVFRVPGAFEIPLVAKRLLLKKKYQAVICLAAIIRGETPHFDFIASEVSKGIAQLNLEFAQSAAIVSGRNAPDAGDAGSANADPRRFLNRIRVQSVNDDFHRGVDSLRQL